MLLERPEVNPNGGRASPGRAHAQLGPTLFAEACHRGHIGGTRIFLALQNPRLDVTLGGWNTNPQLLAIWSGDIAVVRTLLEDERSRFEVNYYDTEQHTTMLMWAIQMGWEEMVKLLLEKGADPNYGNLSYAASARTTISDSVECLKLLLALDGVDVNRLDSRGTSGLLHVVLVGVRRYQRPCCRRQA
ncbi:ankyrin repeat-containing domain protein [Aspergillus karnatakaensis]|uniref:ankyrin repeat domain-containing protein n=1 Tax=Aspergillus karnatakaensis TaxID=1810916 RepID=UPI003CCD00C2